MTLHDLAVDPFQVLTRKAQGLLGLDVVCQSYGHHVHPDPWVVKGLLWPASVPNSAEEKYGITVDLYDTTIGFRFFCPFPAHNRRKTLDLRGGFGNERLKS